MMVVRRLNRVRATVFVAAFARASEARWHVSRSAKRAPSGDDPVRNPACIPVGVLGAMRAIYLSV